MKKVCRSLNLSVKMLLFIGVIALLQTAVSIFFDVHATSPADVAIRSIMSSIFGFIFGGQTVHNTDVISAKAQIVIASWVASICLTVTITSHWIRIDQDSAPAVELRNLLFSAVGFLLSRTEHKE